MINTVWKKENPLEMTFVGKQSLQTTCFQRGSLLKLRKDGKLMSSKTTFERGQRGSETRVLSTKTGNRCYSLKVGWKNVGRFSFR